RSTAAPEGTDSTSSRETSVAAMPAVSAAAASELPTRPRPTTIRGVALRGEGRSSRSRSRIGDTRRSFVLGRGERDFGALSGPRRGRPQPARKYRARLWPPGQPHFGPLAAESLQFAGRKGLGGVGGPNYHQRGADLRVRLRVVRSSLRGAGGRPCRPPRGGCPVSRVRFG